MKIDMSAHDLAICIASLESSAKDLRSGILASERLGLFGRGDMLEKTASEMDDLASRLRTAGQAPPRPLTYQDGLGRSRDPGQ